MSVVDTIYRRMKDDIERVADEEATEKAESEVAKFYGGLSILVTGGTDLLGKCLLEKLLRSCRGLDRVYVLLRVKKGQDFRDKCDKLRADPVFESLRKAKVDLTSKLIPIKGDLTQERLGLSDEDHKSLVEQTSVIFHNGSSPRLDEQVTVALQTNVHGTRRMLELARECKRLKVFVLVSSAYSHCPERVVEEKFYRSPADLKTVDDMIAADTETKPGLTKESLRMLLGHWPNIFTFTKATAEELVRQCAGRASFACCVFRPSVVISSYKEPTPGYCDSKNGPADFFIKIAMGAIHVVYSIDYPVDIVPADMSANAMIVCAWDAVDRWQTEPEAFVYNFGTSHEKPVTMRQIKEKIMNEPGALVSSKSKRMPYVVFATNYVMYFFLRILIDYLPALIIDVFTVLHGNPPEAWSLVRSSMGDMCRLRRFTEGNWRVRMPETLKAYERLNGRDRELFDGDVRRLDWDDYFLTFWRGIRANVLHEVFQAGDEAGKRCCCPCRRCPCKCACYGLIAVLGLVVYYVFVTLF
ncbi:fatty acyl-CoA reductase 1 [Copidosoma floridanum]|uniref:fatty acyl-CoA reductase 1 n=1 Tax=Copidosoma floridanum TaxID=29053 RepID=UPI0006C9C474|nr:fatty acyl-CoA reductase 1 [Copidosoma floridanum]